MHKKYLYKAPGRQIDKIEYSGIVDWDGLYALISNFFISRRYIFTETSNKFKADKIGYHYEIEMEAWRKVTNYFKYWQKLYIRIWEKELVEVIKEGQKKKMYRMRFFIEFMPALETDYQKRFEKSELGEKFRDWIEKYLLKREIEFRHWDSLYYETIALRNEIKNYLNIQV